MNQDWFDKLTDGAPLLCSTIQLSIIDGLLRVSPIIKDMFIISGLETVMIY